MRVQSERAKLVSYVRVFVKFVVFLVENFIFNVSFEVCVRSNSIFCLKGTCKLRMV